MLGGEVVEREQCVAVLGHFFHRLRVFGFELPHKALVRLVRINLISAITNQGKMRFMLYRETLTAQVLIKFLTRLIREAGGKKVFLILDNLRVHHSKLVQAWLEQEENKKAIELFFLPSYSPELNPDEYLNGDLKARMSAGEPVRSDGQRQGKVLSHLRSLQKQPDRIRSYFRHEKIRYAA
ncbi:hypothetical protein GCM10011289_21700 [Paludibacterium paludis]|uniref:Tc1-like transposase DDE domain-containing protein n=1 Tax=Paludibacterium paludis TaxID=1225769 RepID=A0A918P4V6_9NEIS|nr:hypothetical protein GCM10011289_21700 [Paludibacterium paludis]